MVTSVRTETREQMLRRLANKAREHGVQLRKDKNGRHFASSVSRPGTWHYCTAISCDCIGFHRRQKCMHHAALLSALGWVGDEPTPEPDSTFASSKVDAVFVDTKSDAVSKTLQTEQPTICRFCQGQGSTASTELFNGRRMDILVTCWHCRGTGQERIAA